MAEIPDLQNNSASSAQGEPSPSLLDRVISSQQVATMEQFHPVETVAALLQGLPPKDEDVLRRRYGLSDNDAETLEDIGKHYGVTRERIRQIQSGALARVRATKHFEASRTPLEQFVVGTLTTAGGAMEAEQLTRELLGFSGDSPAHRRAVEFLLREILHDRIVLHAETSALRSSWALVGHSDEAVLKIIRDTEAYVEKAGKPVDQAVVLRAAREFPKVAAGTATETDEAILAALGRSKALGANPFSQWGLTKWGSIAPRRIDDKIRIILERAGEPLHFTEIAKRINEAQFDDRTAYPPTVHNELILNAQYVLVGRGLYALKSWGFTEGVVADVVAEVLRAAARPMTKTEIVNAVLEQRFVKRNTVHLALSDRTRFRRNEDGTFVIHQTP